MQIETRDTLSTRAIFLLLTNLVLGGVCLVYWPVHQAGFVWIDKICFHDTAWLRQGDSWKQFIFHNFYEWINYFRPLVVALFVFEVRVLDVSPGPMHLVSLGIHLTNTLLVGLLALSLSEDEYDTRKTRIYAASAMLLYGLHPALIEPVVWISCQFELVVTFFVLAGLLLNSRLQHSAMRALGVATCFFFAACAKESAASFPLLLFLFDWIQTDRDSDNSRPATRLRSQWQRQWLIYLCVSLAAIAYISLRWRSLGFLLQPNGGEPFFSLARWQSVGFLYLTYLRILVWPMTGLGPLHVMDARIFAVSNMSSLAIDFGALAILLGGLYFACKRKPLGCLITAATIALLPVLHIVPVAFDSSLYHERYAMTAIALSCALLPSVVRGIHLPNVGLRGASFAWLVIAVAWLALAVMNIRVTLPLWSDETKLWSWVLRQEPESLEAKEHLLTTYIELDDRPHARQIADALLLDTRPCPMCLVNIANLAMADGDLGRATTSLDKAKNAIYPRSDNRLIQAFILATGLLREMKNDPQGAEEAYRDAITMEPLDPLAQMNLALLLARQGRAQEANRQMDLTIGLFAPDERDARRKQFERTLSAAGLPQPPLPSGR